MMTMHPVAAVTGMIEAGKTLLLAGDERLLAQLPGGNWIGGTTTYFMSEHGGTETRDEIFVADISDWAQRTTITTYSEKSLPEMPAEYPAAGFSVMILPGLSNIHNEFATNVHRYKGIFNAPLVGWVSGGSASETAERTPRVFAGSGRAIENEAAVMHVTLPNPFTAHVNIVNLFTQSPGPAIMFDSDGFEAGSKCLIDGKPGNLISFIEDHSIDTRLPLVADYHGAMINVSISAVDEAAGKVRFYAPVFKGLVYRFARSLPGYDSNFDVEAATPASGDVAFACNCIHNYRYAELKGRKAGPFTGPVTFGEIAYILLNQTLVYLTITRS